MPIVAVSSAARFGEASGADKAVLAQAEAKMRNPEKRPSFTGCP